MNYSNFKRRPTKKVLFVWDGSKQSVETAERFADSIQNAVMKTVHVMPHEAFHAYATVGHSSLEPSRQERQLIKSFETAAKASQHLAHTKLEFLFGERILEIARLAEVIKADFILLPTFEQSIFSTWIHGNLNERIAGKAICPVVFYGSQSKGCPLVDIGKQSTENSSFKQAN